MKLKRKPCIAIIGLGLIGGSLAKVLSKNGYEIIGISKSKETIESALKKKIIKKGFLEISSEALKDVDILFICTPLSLIKEKIKEIAKVVKHDLLLSDVGSTKFDICNYAKKVLPKNITFIGGHPMAGNEYSGFNYSDENLFKNCAWVLIEDKNKNNSQIKELKEIIKHTNSKVIISTANNHDKAVALISHLPILISSMLCKLLKDESDKDVSTLAQTLAASGFRDTTRIASGNPRLSTDLVHINKTYVKVFLEKYLKYLKNVDFNEDQLLKDFKEISSFRQKMYLKKD